MHLSEADIHIYVSSLKEPRRASEGGGVPWQVLFSIDLGSRIRYDAPLIALLNLDDTADINNPEYLSVLKIFSR